MNHSFRICCIISKNIEEQLSKYLGVVSVTKAINVLFVREISLSNYKNMMCLIGTINAIVEVSFFLKENSAI